jgi:ketosteroid isomerase-like protein
MSRANVQVVRAAFEAWNAGRMDALRELYDPGAVTVTVPEGWPEPAPVVGREAVMRGFVSQREALDADTVESIGDFIAAGDRVVVRLVWRGSGHGPDMNMELTGVYTVRKGKISLVEHFWDHAEALEAIGLEARTTSAESAEECVRQMFAGVSNKDAAAIEAVCDPDWELTSRFTGVEGRIYRGHAGVADYLADMEAVWESLRLTVEDLLPVGEEKFVVVTRAEGVARGSGVPIDERTYGAFEFRQDKALRARVYSSQEEALEALGPEAYLTG